MFTAARAGRGTGQGHKRSQVLSKFPWGVWYRLKTGIMSWWFLRKSFIIVSVFSTGRWHLERIYLLSPYTKVKHNKGSIVVPKGTLSNASFIFASSCSFLWSSPDWECFSAYRDGDLPIFYLEVSWRVSNLFASRTCWSDLIGMQHFTPCMTAKQSHTSSAATGRGMDEFIPSLCCILHA